MQKNQGFFIVGLIFAILITVFALTNANVVAIHLFLYQFQASQALIIFISAALGAIIVIALGLTKQFKMAADLKKLRKENDTLTKKVEEMMQSAAENREPEASDEPAGQENQKEQNASE